LWDFRKPSAPFPVTARDGAYTPIRSSPIALLAVGCEVFDK
jgi:hypothetical protein